MKKLENKIPPPLVATLIGVIMWLVSRQTYVLPLSETLCLILAMLIVALGGFFSLAGVVSFRRAKTTVNPLKPETASSLVNSGIYRFSRNPMYVGFALFLFAWAIYLAAPVATIGVVFFVLYMNRFQIEPEEQALVKIFGDEFNLYCDRVRRWI